eukprot:SM001139S24273  [mRNA]  locus=s1139:75:745:+ [translate_table: standard]
MIVQSMGLELRKLETAVEQVRMEMEYFRLREEIMRNTNENTNARVAWFSLIALFICLGLAAWQLWHLKVFFEHKKIL